ncbi:glycosyltransferase family A protein, partial [Chryseosolibacter indicus]
MEALRQIINPITRAIRDFRDLKLRRYNEEKLPAEIYDPSLEKRKVSFCTTCMNRFFHLRKTFIKNIEDNIDYPNVEFVLLNYNSKDELHQWAQKTLPKYIERGIVNYYYTDRPDFFHASIAKNLAHKVAQGDIVCNLDGDNFTGKDFAYYLNYKMHVMGDNTILHVRKSPYWGTEGRIVLTRKNFIELGGYDESFEPIGHEDHDLLHRAKAYGLKYENVLIENFLHYLSNTT